MKEYRKIVQFYYNSNFYNMYLDNQNKRFFLKYDINGKLSYLTIEEIIDLSIHFTSIPFVMKIEKDTDRNKIKLVPKVFIGGVAVTLSLAIFSTALSMYQSQKRIKNFEQNYYRNSQISGQNIENYISYDDTNKQEDNKNDEQLIVDTYLSSDWLNYLYIYDMDYLDKALDYDNISIEQVKDQIKNNSFISNKFKKLMYDYCDSIIKQYPNIELRVLYENLKTLEVIECDREELIKKSLSIDSYGCYVRTENKIYVLKDHEYKKRTWDYQVIFHEFSHCLRTGVWNKDDNTIKVQVEGQNFNNTITAEALNSLFTVSLFDYEEKDIAYQLQSNYHSIMIDCMDNYSLEDYINHSLSYYAKKLDEFNNDDNYSTVILELIQMQYNDYHSKSINVSQDSYYPIYNYISDMYYKKYINSNMTYSESKKVTEKLLDTIMSGVPEDYNIDTNHFYDHLQEYCNSIGINTNMKAR